MTRISSGKLKPTCSDAICNLTPEFFFQQTVSCREAGRNSAALCRAVHKTAETGVSSLSDQGMESCCTISLKNPVWENISMCGFIFSGSQQVRDNSKEKKCVVLSTAHSLITGSHSLRKPPLPLTKVYLFTEQCGSKKKGSEQIALYGSLALAIYPPHLCCLGWDQHCSVGIFCSVLRPCPQRRPCVHTYVVELLFSVAHTVKTAHEQSGYSQVSIWPHWRHHRGWRVFVKLRLPLETNNFVPIAASVLPQWTTINHLNVNKCADRSCVRHFPYNSCIRRTSDELNPMLLSSSCTRAW